MKSELRRTPKSAEEDISSMKSVSSEAKVTKYRLVSPKTIARFASNYKIVMSIVAITMLLVICLCLADSASSMPTATIDRAPALFNNGNNLNTLEDLISDMIYDAERAKKAKTNGIRQVKQTLRFGKRSDPYFGSTLSEQQLMAEELGLSE